MISSGSAQFAAQAFGILIALLVSHLIARRLGAGPEADAFLLGRRLVTSLGETLSQIFVVVFIPLIAARSAAGDSAGRILARSCGTALAIGSMLAVSLVLIAPFLVAIVAPEFDRSTATLATRVVTIFALALPSTVVTIALASYCNVQGRFGLPATIRQLPRAAVAVVLALGGGALAITAAAAYSVAFLAVAVLTFGLALRLRPEPAEARDGSTRGSAVKQRGSAAILLAVGALASIWLETSFAAAQGAGSLAMLDYSQRLGALCGNTLAMALALVAFADLSRRAAEGATADLARRFGRATLTAMALLLPLQIGLFVNARAVVDIILAHGEFSLAARDQVTELLRWMAIAPLGALLSRMLLVRVLAEQELPIVRLVGGAIALDVLVRLALFILLTPWLGLLAIPVSLVVAPVGPIVFLGLMLRRRAAFDWRDALKSTRPMLIVSALCCLAITVGATLGPALESVARPLLGDMPKLGSLSRIAASGLLGALVLGAGIKVFGIRPAMR